MSFVGLIEEHEIMKEGEKYMDNRKDDNYYNIKIIN